MRSITLRSGRDARPASTRPGLRQLIKNMYSDVSVASDGAGHTGRSDLNSSREAADTTPDGSLFQSLAVLGKKEMD